MGFPAASDLVGERAFAAGLRDRGHPRPAGPARRPSISSVSRSSWKVVDLDRSVPAQLRGERPRGADQRPVCGSTARAAASDRPTLRQTRLASAQRASAAANASGRRTVSRKSPTTPVPSSSAKKSIRSAASVTASPRRRRRRGSPLGLPSGEEGVGDRPLAGDRHVTCADTDRGHVSVPGRGAADRDRPCTRPEHPPSASRRRRRAAARSARQASRPPRRPRDDERAHSSGERVPDRLLHPFVTDEHERCLGQLRQIGDGREAAGGPARRRTRVHPQAVTPAGLVSIDSANRGEAPTIASDRGRTSACAGPSRRISPTKRSRLRRHAPSHPGRRGSPRALSDRGSDHVQCPRAQTE